jgi:multidrug efflux pump
MAGMGDAESVVATVSPSSGGGGFFGGGGAGTVAISFRDYQDREHDVFETLKTLQEEIGVGIAGADVTVTKPQNGPPSGKPINIEIAGDDPVVLRRLGDQMLAVLRAAPVGSRLEGLDSDMSQGRPELVVEVDRERAALYGLSTAQVGSTVRSAIQGTEAAKFRWGRTSTTSSCAWPSRIARTSTPWRISPSSRTGGRSPSPPWLPGEPTRAPRA